MRYASLLWSVPMTLLGLGLFVVGLVTGRVPLGWRTGARGGPIVETWQRDPAMFALTLALLLALALAGLIVTLRVLRRR